MKDGLEIREVRESDREEIEALSEGIWDGWDYIPDMFEAWVEDGGFICGEEDGKIIGLAKHTWHKDGVLWLEGLRVHPDHQCEGYGRKMIKGQIDHIDELDYDVVRFLTSGDKIPVRKVVEDLGFELKKSYDYFYLDEDQLEEMDQPSKDEFEGVEQEKNTEEVIRFVFSSPEYERNGRLYVEGWTAYDIEEDLIRDRIKRGDCYSITEQGEIKAVMFVYLNEIYDSVSVPFISGEEGDMKKLLNFGLKNAIENGRRTFRVKTASERVVSAAKATGLKRSDHGCSVVYEKSGE